MLQIVWTSKIKFLEKQAQELEHIKRWWPGIYKRVKDDEHITTLQKQLAEAKAEIARLIALKGNAQPEKG